jgi:hypothetical protein
MNYRVIILSHRHQLLVPEGHHARRVAELITRRTSFDEAFSLGITLTSVVAELLPRIGEVGHGIVGQKTHGSDTCRAGGHLPELHDANQRIKMRSIHERIFLVQHSKILALALGFLCAGCGSKSTVSPDPLRGASGAATQGVVAQADPAAQCKSWGIQPDSPDFKRCVDGMTEAASAGTGADGAQSTEQAQAEMAKMRDDMAHQRDAIRKQVDEDMKAAANNPKCVTVTNGSNTSVSCP